MTWFFTPSAAGTFHYSFNWANHDYGSGFNGNDISPWGEGTTATISGTVAVTSGQVVDLTVIRPGLLETSVNTEVNASVYLTVP
jgi:hypothetical protein